MTEATGDGAVLRPAATMATGTIISRITGMVRNSVLIAAIGTAVFADTYTVANTLPNILYILTIGGALNAVLIPQLVRRAAADADGGDAYTDRLLTAAGGVLLVITILAMALSPLLIRLYASREWSAEDLRVSVLFALCCLPQIVCYGLFTVLSQILNVRGRFGAPMFAPILNNVVVIVTCLIFLSVVSGAPQTSTISNGQIALLGIGTTLGVATQAVALAVVLWRAGYRYRPRFDLKGSGLGRAAGLAGWTLVLVAVNQAAFLLITRIATTAGARAEAAGADVGAGITAYSTAHLVFVLPHSVIAVSVVTALFPRMSAHASAGRLDKLRDDVAGALSSLAPLLVPAAVAMLLFGELVAVALFNYGVTNLASAELIGRTLQLMALGLLPFSAYFVLMRGCYAVEDTRTPALLAIPLGLLNVLIGWGLARSLPAEDAITGLAAGMSAAYLLMLAPMLWALRRHYDGLPLNLPLGRYGRLLAASAGAGAAALAVVALLRSTVVDALQPSSAILLLTVAALVMSPVYLVLSRLAGVDDVEAAVRRILRR